MQIYNTKAIKRKNGPIFICRTVFVFLELLALLRQPASVAYS